MQSFDETWEKIHATEEWGKYPSESVIRFVARNYYNKDRKSIKILDFCCGGGANTWYLTREGFDVYAFDGSQSAVRKIKDRLKAEGLSADIKVCDALETNYEDNFFDCIIDNVSICANRKSAIIAMYEEIYRMLKAGGRIFTTVFSQNTTGFGLGIEIEKNTFNHIEQGNLAGRGIIHFYDQKEITEMLSDVGFHSINVDFLNYTDRGNIVEQFLIQAEK